jgi:hypothetical protein
MCAQSQFLCAHKNDFRALTFGLISLFSRTFRPTMTFIQIIEKTGNIVDQYSSLKTSKNCHDNIFDHAQNESKKIIRSTFTQALRFGEPSTCILRTKKGLCLNAFFPFHGLLSKSAHNPLSIVNFEFAIPKHILEFLNGCGITFDDECESDVEALISMAPSTAGNAYVLDKAGKTLYSEIRAIPHEPTDGKHYSIWCEFLPDYAEAIHGSFESAMMGTASSYVMIMNNQHVLCNCFPFFAKADEPLLQYAICYVLNEEHRNFLNQAGIPI